MPISLRELAERHRIRSGRPERVGEAARRLGTSARMLRYAEDLGLAAPPRTAGGYRAYGERELLAAALALELQARHGVAPAALAFGLRAISDPEVARELRLLARLGRSRTRSPAVPHSGPRWGSVADGGMGRPPLSTPPVAAALQFETDKGRRLLRLAS
jgi:MerR family copper efflux transcriptional regulator